MSSADANAGLRLAIGMRQRGREEGLAAAGLHIPPAMVDDLAVMMLARQIVGLETRLAKSTVGSWTHERLLAELDRARLFQDRLIEKRMQQSEAETERLANAAMRDAMTRATG
jgi:hypothetical protein